MFDSVLTEQVLQTGLLSLSVHCLLYCLFAYVLPDGPWSKLPSYTAHQAVSLPLMIYVSYQGILVWFFNPQVSEFDTSEARIKTLTEEGMHIAEFVFGFLLFWDIPVSLMTPVLNDALMMAHHIGMLFISGVAMGIFTDQQPRGSYYAPFFIGVIEFSTIFLVFVDVFHPKYKYWYEFLKAQESKKTRIGDLLSGANNIARILFGLSFLLLRFFYFPYVVFSVCLWDFWAVANDTKETTLFVTCFSMFLFTGLQLHWGLLIAKQLLKVLSPSSEKKTN